MFVSFCLKTSPHLLKLFRRMSQHCFVVTLKKSVVEYETVSDIPSERTTIMTLMKSGWTYPLSCNPIPQSNRFTFERRDKGTNFSPNCSAVYLLHPGLQAACFLNQTDVCTVFTEADNRRKKAKEYFTGKCFIILLSTIFFLHCEGRELPLPDLSELNNNIKSPLL